MLKNWVELQYTEEAYFFVADWHALTSDYADPSNIRTNIREMVKDWVGAGLDPEKAPATWQELVAMGKKLTKKDESGKVSQWGVAIPSTGYAYWMLQALAITNGVELMNDAGNKVFFDNPKNIEALQFLTDLAYKYEVSPKGTIDWSTTPRDFFERKTAIMWTTTGNLTNVRTNAKFPFGVAMLPANARLGSPTGGGNFYIFKNSTPEERKAAVKFVQWMTTAERAAQWGIDTGYVAVRPDAWKTARMEEYVKGFPYAAVARDQLTHAVPELSTHENQRVTKALDDAIQAAVNGSKKSEDALKDAQREADIQVLQQQSVLIKLVIATTRSLKRQHALVVLGAKTLIQVVVVTYRQLCIHTHLHQVQSGVTCLLVNLKF